MSSNAIREDRRTARAVGMLYILATVAGVMAAVANAPTALSAMAASENAVLLTALAELVMAVAVVGVACMLYPVLMRDADTRVRQGMAVWFVCARATEGVLFLVGIIALLAMLGVSQAAAAGAASAVIGAGQAVGAALGGLSQYSWALGQTVFCIGAWMMYWLLLKSNRIPRWLAVWGLIAAPLMLLGGLMLPFTHDPSSTVSSILYAPMGLQEMVLAVWLIARGFRPSALAVEV